MAPSNEERITRVEVRQEQALLQLAEMQADIAEIKKAVTSWRGVVLGVVLTVSVMWSGAIGLWQAFRHKVGA